VHGELIDGGGGETGALWRERGNAKTESKKELVSRILSLYIVWLVRRSLLSRTPLDLQQSLYRSSAFLSIFYPMCSDAIPVTCRKPCDACIADIICLIRR
jgi:hypothetical protein